MMDCHVHTKRCHHGTGELEDFVQVACDKGLKILGFAEHAPFVYDTEQRMTEGETIEYLMEIRHLQLRYKKHIKILVGLEVDFAPSALPFLRQFLLQIECDFLLGAVHFIEMPRRILRVWDYPLLQAPEVWQRYFDTLGQAIASCLFDGIAHPDMLLRAGIPPSRLRPYLAMVVKGLHERGQAYELNCSGLTKPSFDSNRKTMTNGPPTYPNMDFAMYAHSQAIPFVIGSDAHSPEMVGTNICLILEELRKRGVRTLTYFERRRALSVHI